MKDSARFRTWWYDVMAFLKEAYTLPDTQRAAAEDVLAMTRYLHDLMARVSQEGGSELLERLADAESVEDLLNEEELIANAIHYHSNRVGKPFLTLLRYDSPVQFTGRRAVADLELGGRRIKEGDHVVLFLGAANRDPEVFPDPDRFDITRESKRHLAFGLGLHFCLGAPLARLEGAIVFRTLPSQMPGLSLADEPLQSRPTFRSRSGWRLLTGALASYGRYSD